MWHKEERFRRAKKIWNVENERRYRVSSSISVIHHESQIDSGQFDTEIDLTPEVYHGSKLGGIRHTGAGYQLAYQNFESSKLQKGKGSFGFGGRRGQQFINMCPHRIGYLHEPTKGFQSVFGEPRFSSVNAQINEKIMGIGGDDPSIWKIKCDTTLDAGDIWERGDAKVRYQIRLSGAQVEPIFTLNQAARDTIAAHEQPRTRAAETCFGVLLSIDFNDIDRILLGGVAKNRHGDDFAVDKEFSLEDGAHRRLANIGRGAVFVPNRGGNVDIVKYIWRDDSGQWWFFMGANVSQMNANLLRGDLVIDPPITEESIAANADDADQSGTTMALNGSFSSRDYIGRYGSNLYHAGWIFSSVPIGNGDTINSATLEPRRSASSGSVDNLTATLAGIDEDNAAAFTTTASNLSGRADTPATLALTVTEIPADQTRASWDVSGMVEDITGRGGWATNNRLGFTAVSTTPGGNNHFAGFDDYTAGAANAADFNADVEAGAAPTFNAIARMPVPINTELDGNKVSEASARHGFSFRSFVVSGALSSFDAVVRAALSLSYLGTSNKSADGFAVARMPMLAAGANEPVKAGAATVSLPLRQRVIASLVAGFDAVVRIAVSINPFAVASKASTGTSQSSVSAKSQAIAEKSSAAVARSSMSIQAVLTYVAGNVTLGYTRVRFGLAAAIARTYVKLGSAFHSMATNSAVTSQVSRGSIVRARAAIRASGFGAKLQSGVVHNRFGMRTQLIAVPQGAAQIVHTVELSGIYDPTTPLTGRAENL